MPERNKIIAGKLLFTSSTESIFGQVVPNSEVAYKFPYFIRKRNLPRTDNNFHPTKERCELWEVVLGNKSFFYKTLVEAELAVLGNIGR